MKSQWKLLIYDYEVVSLGSLMGGNLSTRREIRGG